MTTVCEQHTHICIQTAVYADYNYAVIDQSTRINDDQTHTSKKCHLKPCDTQAVFWWGIAGVAKWAFDQLLKVVGHRVSQLSTRAFFHWPLPAKVLPTQRLQACGF